MDSNKKMTDETSSSFVHAAHEDTASPRFDKRPWGSFTVLDEGAGFKVKRLEVLPGKRMSYQYHAHRAEHMVVVKGKARITLDGVESIVDEGETVDVPVGARHRIANGGSERLVLIEIQRGSYLGEDDIVRLEDDFQRT
jgi:mannose-6-phosphate isomerase